MRPGRIEVVPRINTRLLADARRRVFYHIGKSFELSYMIKTLRGDAHNVQRKAASQPHIGAQSVQVPHE